jgi:hypothetical protein
MKKMIPAAILFAASAAFLLTGCVGPEGAVYTAFDWVYSPSYLAIGDQAIPAVVYPGTYYMTSPGTYSLEYGHPSYYPPYARYITYTVTAYPGKPGMRQGSDALFTVWLYETKDPVFVEDSTPRAARRAASGGPAQAEPAAQSAPAAGGGKRIRQYSYTESRDGYEISVEGGLVER